MSKMSREINLLVSQCFANIFCIEAILDQILFEQVAGFDVAMTVLKDPEARNWPKYEPHAN